MRLFLSYAHSDHAAKDKFLLLLNEYLRVAQGVDFSVWQDLALLPGQDWHAEIQRAVDACDAGLLLVSPALLGRDYIAKFELPALMAKGVVPVLLEPIRFDGTMNLRGLEAKQVFRDAKGRAFGELASKTDRRRFVDQLFGQLMAKAGA